MTNKGFDSKDWSKQEYFDSGLGFNMPMAALYTVSKLKPQWKLMQKFTDDTNRLPKSNEECSWKQPNEDSRTKRKSLN